MSGNEFGSVLIGYATRDYSPCPAFYDCLAKLETLPKTLVPFQSRTGVLPGQRNRICREAQRLGVDWVWMLDDDQLFDPLALKKLISHGLDAVIGLSLRRKPPFAPLIFDRLDADGNAHQYYLKKHENGVIPIAGAGMGSLLIRRSVLDAMGDPWFQFERSIGNYDDYAEDFPFYRKLRETGTQLHCDLNVRLGHAFTSYLWPTRDKDGNWQTTMADDQPFATFPSAQDPSPIVIPDRRFTR